MNYISIHDVPKPSSKSTALRIVSNSSLNNGNRGLSYNDCLPKGPNSLVPLMEATVASYYFLRVVCWTTPSAITLSLLLPMSSIVEDSHEGLMKMESGSSMGLTACILVIDLLPLVCKLLNIEW